MIHKITRARDFGSFSDFRWQSAVPKFKRINLIYGWNYSGKTTLSKILACFEHRQKNAQFPQGTAELQLDDGTLCDLSFNGTVPSVRVFNTDFVKRNLFFEDAGAEPILILGSEDIQKRADLDDKRSQRVAANKRRADNEATVTSKTKVMNDSLTQAAKRIKTDYGRPDYDRDKFAPRVKSTSGQPEKYTLSEDLKIGTLQQYRTQEARKEIAPASGPPSVLAGVLAKVAAALQRTVTPKHHIERLRQCPALEKWVNEGRPLHVGQSQCQFCEQDLPEALIERLAGHFTSEYDLLMKDLAELAGSIDAALGERAGLPSAGDFYPDLSSLFEPLNELLTNRLEERREALAALKESVEAKKTHAFSALTPPMVEDPTESIDASFLRVNAIVREHNLRNQNFQAGREKAFSKLELHLAAEFALDNSFAEYVAEERKITVEIQQDSGQIKVFDADIRKLEGELSEAARGAERINELLGNYFSKQDIRVEVEAGKKFRIIRASSAATNLSEGEKTAIAFAYFVTRAQDKQTGIEDLVIVIDDPISSLDASHLFNTYALIKTELGNAKQLIVLTHNFDFYSLMLDWAEEDSKIRTSAPNDRKWGILHMKRIGEESRLDLIPKELLKFKSEYHYLFATLVEFAADGDAEFDRLMSLPNITRRFMEAFGGIMIPIHAGLKNKMERLFPNPIERECVWKYINQFSHNTTVMRSLAVPDISECKSVVRLCLKAVESWNPVYFADLKSSIN